ncbi:hypothetical protein B7H23_13000 [Notoacmeibacter marinus]|uniref:Uncharacterized protein n=1 Tax=Notoacmeibacter marinus TaxID=1876515 RepID=A0A231UTB0_9HYPH|nr:hypothetical protein [Notoacmeibacter marinus]OXS99116.1 hypothetical protein B7H23_13000 [Notoacmeibacter marinus]
MSPNPISLSVAAFAALSIPMVLIADASAQNTVEPLKQVIKPNVQLNKPAMQMERNAASRPKCAPEAYEAYGRSAAVRRSTRESRAKQRAIRRWTRAIEGRDILPRNRGKPVYGTDYSDFNKAKIVSFNCSGRPLTCKLIARPCR